MFFFVHTGNPSMRTNQRRSNKNILNPVVFVYGTDLKQGRAFYVHVALPSRLTNSIFTAFSCRLVFISLAHVAAGLKVVFPLDFAHIRCVYPICRAVRCQDLELMCACLIDAECSANLGSRWSLDRCPSLRSEFSLFSESALLSRATGHFDFHTETAANFEKQLDFLSMQHVLLKSCSFAWSRNRNMRSILFTIHE